MRDYHEELEISINNYICPICSGKVLSYRALVRDAREEFTCHSNGCFWLGGNLKVNIKDGEKTYAFYISPHCGEHKLRVYDESIGAKSTDSPLKMNCAYLFPDIATILHFHEFCKNVVESMIFI
jgi:predicted RNA-binding Zn-ribbon protein involved in translation (DUF1610 family)